MQTPIIRCTSDPGYGVCTAESQFCTAESQIDHGAGNWQCRPAPGWRQRTAGRLGPAVRGSGPELARGASPVPPVKTARCTLLLACLMGGGLTFAGCASSPDESSPESSEARSPIEFFGWNQPVRPDHYYAVMASAAASAYPARFEQNTVEVDGRRVLRADQNFRIFESTTDPTKITTYFDTSSAIVTRVILAFRGTVHPSLGSPFSNWTDIGVDVWSQFVKVKHKNPLLDSDSAGRVGAGWALRWEQVATLRNNQLKKLMEDVVAYSRTHHMEINVVGHSLGGVVAELAGLDIEEFLHRNATNYEVNVVAFNPPKLGSQRLVDEYRRRLKERPKQFRISVFTREGDIVDDVPVSHLGVLVGYYRQVINNVAHDNLSPLCSKYMSGGADDPSEAGPDAEPQRLPYAPRLHVTKPFAYGSHSIDDWVGNPEGNIEYRQVFDLVNPIGFRCMFAPYLLGEFERRRLGTPHDAKLNCTEYATLFWTVDCSPAPPPGENPREDL
jgi:hypothetical protein